MIDVSENTSDVWIIIITYYIPEDICLLYANPLITFKLQIFFMITFLL